MLMSTTTRRCVNVASRLTAVESHYPSIKSVGNFRFTEHILIIGQSRYGADKLLPRGPEESYLTPV